MTQRQSRKSAGEPDPLDFRYHRGIGSKNTDSLYNGSSFTDSVDATCVVPTAGQLLVRLRGKFTKGGTLNFKWCRPVPQWDGDTPTTYDPSLDPPHGNVAVVADTEFLVDIEPGGESNLLLTFTPDDDGEVTFLNVMYQ